MIFIIDDDEIMASCLARYVRPEKTRWFSNTIEAINALDDDFPDLILLDVLLDGPDGFTLLNELVSYEDTAKIPVVLVSSLNFDNVDLSVYGVRAILDKGTMTPESVKATVAGLLGENDG